MTSLVHTAARSLLLAGSACLLTLGLLAATGRAAPGGTDSNGTDTEIMQRLTAGVPAAPSAALAAGVTVTETAVILATAPLFFPSLVDLHLPILTR